jgi:tetratricopeptide (TPR) repeat protein
VAPPAEPVTPPPAPTAAATPAPRPEPVAVTPAQAPQARDAVRPRPTGPGRRAQAHELVKKGDGLRSSGDVEGAIKAYLAAEAADPALPALQKKLAVCYQQQGDTRAARARYQRYLATDPPDAAKVRLILENLQ